MAFDEIKQAIERQHSAFDAFAKNQNERFDALDREAELTRQRLADLETRAGNPGLVANYTDRDAKEHMDRFTAWLRQPGSGEAKNRLGEFQEKLRDTKAMTIGSNADGAFAMPATTTGARRRGARPRT